VCAVIVGAAGGDDLTIERAADIPRIVTTVARRGTYLD
jgi:hypothetical protein